MRRRYFLQDQRSIACNRCGAEGDRASGVACRRLRRSQVGLGMLIGMMARAGLGWICVSACSGDMVGIAWEGRKASDRRAAARRSHNLQLRSLPSLRAATFTAAAFLRGCLAGDFCRRFAGRAARHAASVAHPARAALFAAQAAAEANAVHAAIAIAAVGAAASGLNRAGAASRRGKGFGLGGMRSRGGDGAACSAARVHAVGGDAGGAHQQRADQNQLVHFHLRSWFVKE